MLFPLRLAAITAALLLNGLGPAEVPRYDHVFVIVDENKDVRSILGGRSAPEMNAMANAYGVATHYDAVAHPSEPNYVALVGGSTFGIRDDASFVKNAVDAPNLATQLGAAHLSWKGYYEDIPAPGSLAVSSGLYASKHSGFLNFLDVQRDPQRAEHLVGFDQLERDAAAGTLPNFALIVPNLCNDMHGVMSLTVPSDCLTMRSGALIARGDAAFKRIVDTLMQSSAWKSAKNVAIVLTFDENDGSGSENRVAAIVMTNHGPRRRSDDTPYTHYSLLRTVEAALGLSYLGNARTALPMTTLFSTAP